jgi:hypothetical protein
MLRRPIEGTPHGPGVVVDLRGVTRDLVWARSIFKRSSMPSCFQLIRDGDAVPLSQVDEEMCRHFDAECHPTCYFEGWHDAIGFFLATGRTFDQIRVIYADDPTLVRIADWLESNFTSRHWYETKSHPRDR